MKIYWEKIFKNGDIIRTEILDKIDATFAADMLALGYRNKELVTKCITDHNWSENHISKPSKMVSQIISKINFDETPESKESSEIFENIKDSITDEENEKYYERIREIIDTCDKSKTALSPLLLEYLKESPIETFDVGSEEKQNIFSSLCNLIENNPDLAQNEEILKIIVPLYQKIRELSEQTISPEKYLEDAIINHVKRSDANIIINLLNQTAISEILKNENMISVIFDRYTELGSNIPEIIRFFLKNTSYSTESIILSKFEEMITSRDAPTFQTLLATAKEEDTEFNSDLIQKIGKICLKEAEDSENPIRYSMYEHAIELKLGSYDRTKVSDYAIELMKDDDPPTQDQGFALLRKFNTMFADKTEPTGITDAIKIAIKLVEDNSERVVQYLGFIFEFKDRFGYSQVNKVIELFRRSLVSDASENIMNNIIQRIIQSPVEVIKDVIDELIDFADITKYANAKEQCKQIFITNKGRLRSRHIERMEEIFGNGVLG